MNHSLSSTLSLFVEGIPHFQANCCSPPRLIEALLIFHKEKYFQAYHSIIIDYNFSPGPYPNDRWTGIISKTLPAIAETNLLAASGTVLVPDWDLVGKEMSPSIQNYFDVKYFEDREQHPLHQATMAAVNAEELQLLNNAKKGYYLFKLKKSMEKDRAIYALENIMKNSTKKHPNVMLAFDRMRGYSPRFPILLDNEDQISQTSPSNVFEGLLNRKNLNKANNKTIRFVGRIDPEGKFFYEENTLKYE